MQGEPVARLVALVLGEKDAHAPHSQVTWPEANLVHGMEGVGHAVPAELLDAAYQKAPPALLPGVVGEGVMDELARAPCP